MLQSHLKTGQQTVRQSAKFIDNALRPIEVRAVQTNAGNLVTGIERGLPSGKLPAKADEYLIIKQAEKDGVLAGNGKEIQIPSVRNNEFNKWFENLSVDKFEEMWNVPHLRCKIEDRIRRPRGYHE